MKKLIFLFIFSSVVLCSTAKADNFSSENHSDANRLFAWAESQYPSLFAPVHGSSQLWEGWYYIYYPSTKNYVGVNIDGEVWVLGDSWHNEMKFISTLNALMSNVPNAARTTNKLNDTGITFGISGTAVNRVYGNNITCAGTAINTQDCSHGRDVTHNDDSDGHAGFSFTKLDANGDDLPASEKSWSCVRDNVTGLIWEAKTENGDIHDKNNRYRWGGVTALGSGTMGNYYDDWDELVNGSNAELLCGYSDWRVPTREELLSLVDYSHKTSLIDRDFFPNNFGLVWSSSPQMISGVGYVNFINGFPRDVGGDALISKDKMQVRLVRNEKR